MGGEVGRQVGYRVCELIQWPEVRRDSALRQGKLS